MFPGEESITGMISRGTASGSHFRFLTWKSCNLRDIRQPPSEWSDASICSLGLRSRFCQFYSPTFNGVEASIVADGGKIRDHF